MSQREEVLAVLGRLGDAWNSGDAEAYGSLFTEDADYVTFFGLRSEGRQAIVDSHRELFEGPLRGSKLSGFGEPRVRFLHDDVAVLVAGGGSSLTGGADPAAEGRASTLTYVLVRGDEGWQITAFQNTRVSKPWEA
ncbi:SgcJ/EcaC family oxidoreductase [Amycolatopsis benzoatilytica]|uniref:SgcJ/EcaC family oxidoreductase n=1 Tax=Amycolatopsis benzoatilytica TaxID=346045 RepID=UPI0003651610|nr:SgcJ/EcaC family oxidoreductase [Amycolatopsis benzoatilytica]